MASEEGESWMHVAVLVVVVELLLGELVPRRASIGFKAPHGISPGLATGCREHIGANGVYGPRHRRASW